MKQLNGFSFSLTSQEADAEDLFQETVLRALQYYRQFRSGTDFRAWVFRIMRNLRANGNLRKRLEPRLIDITDGDWRAGKHGIREEMPPGLLMSEQVQQALRALPGGFRSPLLLADLCGFSYREIAQALGVRVGTVMSRLARGRRLLGGHLEFHRMLVQGWEFLRTLREHLGPLHSSVVIFDFPRRESRVLSLTWAKNEIPPQGKVLPLTYFSPQDILRQGPTRYIEDLTACSRSPAIWQSLARRGISSFLSAPITFGARLIGELNVGAFHPRAFRRRDRSWLRGVADQLGRSWRKSH